MDYKIVADSSCDLTEKLKEKLDIGLVPLKIDVDDRTFIDDESLNIKELLKAMRNRKRPIKTASPSPSEFIEEYEKGENIFVVTLSSKLSGTYNSAVLAKNMILESKNKFIHVFDSLSASSAETVISMKISEFIEKGYEKEKIVDKVEKYIKEVKTFFILESLDNLVKAGRISKLKADIASILSIKPIMGTDKDGNIRLVEKVRGKKKAYRRLIAKIGEEGEKLEEKILVISHCDALEKAEDLKEKVEEKYNFKDIKVIEMAGLSSAYTDEGGIVIAF